MAPEIDTNSEAESRHEEALWHAWRLAETAAESDQATEEESYELRQVARILDKLLRRRGEVTVSMPAASARALVEVGDLEKWDDGADPVLRAGCEALRKAVA